MKLSKEELKKKISDSLPENEELAVSLLEDIEDSFAEEIDTTEVETLKTQNEELKAKYDELLTKYKERFLSNENNSSEEKEENNGLQEEEVINVKEI